MVAGPYRGACALALLAAALVALPAAQGDPIETIEHPTRVPEFKFISLGNGIEPGLTGVYGFGLHNRYNASIDNVTMRVEIYRWATVDDFKNASEVAHPPVFAVGGGLAVALAIPSIAGNGTYDVRLSVLTDDKTPEGVYFTRNQIEFDYANFTEPGNATPRLSHFVMRSRGYFTAEEFASINYSDLAGSLADLGVSGIVPDSSFSVKRAAPVWPLATLVGATALSGVLAAAFYLTETYPGRFPRLKGALLRGEGKVRVWRALAGDELRDRLARRRRPPAR